MRNERSVGDKRPIVVGIDGSPTGLRALGWAVHEAHARECPLQVVHAWDVVPLPGAMFTGADERRRASECFLATEVAAATRQLAHPPVITELSIKGQPASILIERSRHASLLVIGRGNHRAVHDLLPNSVSAACVRGSHCPVLVVPEFRTATEEPHRDEPAEVTSP